MKQKNNKWQKFKDKQLSVHKGGTALGKLLRKGITIATGGVIDGSDIFPIPTEDSETVKALKNQAEENPIVQKQISGLSASGNTGIVPDLKPKFMEKVTVFLKKYWYFVAFPILGTISYFVFKGKSSKSPYKRR